MAVRIRSPARAATVAINRPGGPVAVISVDTICGRHERQRAPLSSSAAGIGLMSAFASARRQRAN
jgi:hypothetical protein